jgi:hypothetical protein
MGHSLRDEGWTMLFLLNDHVIDLVGGAEAARLLVPAHIPLKSVTAAQAVAVLQAEVHADPKIAGTQPDRAKGVCWMIYASTQANAALAVAPPGSRRPSEVGVRLLNVKLITLANLAALQREGRLSSGLVNKSVWLAAA